MHYGYAIGTSVDASHTATLIRQRAICDYQRRATYSNYRTTYFATLLSFEGALFAPSATNLQKCKLPDKRGFFA